MVFTEFFYLLRARRLDVSMNEWMLLVKALDKGLHHNSFTAFYYLCRAVLVKSEKDYDRFDSAFLEFFKGVPPGDTLPEELLRWLNAPAHDKDMERRAAEGHERVSNDLIYKLFRERLAQQKAEHNGGGYWIGTHGSSLFGNDGFGQQGLRVGGKPQKSKAMDIAGQHRFRDFREDHVLNIRQYQMALRRLRNYSSRTSAPKTELDMDETIRQTANSAGRLKLVYARPRKNTVKLLLLMDSGGSMDVYSGLCTALFQAVSRSNDLNDLRIYYFHNCVGPRLFNTPALSGSDSVPTPWVLNNIGPEYRLLVVGDAMMEPGDLLDSYDRRGNAQTSGLQWLQALKRRYTHHSWITPMKKPPFINTATGWGISYDVIGGEFPMFHLSVEGLGAAVRQLMAGR